MDSKLRICSVCHQNYRYCPQCQEDQLKPTWYFAFCHENCRDIYDIASSFEDGRIDANTAKIQLEKLDLSKIDNFGESYKKTINRIMESSSVAKQVKAQEVEKTVENKETVANSDKYEQMKEMDNEFEEEKSIKKPRTKRAKNVE